MSALLPLTQLRRLALSDLALSDAMLAPVLPPVSALPSGSATANDEGEEAEEGEGTEEEDSDGDPGEHSSLLPSLTYLSVQGLRVIR